jgi:hypothetical protein
MTERSVACLIVKPKALGRLAPNWSCGFDTGLKQARKVNSVSATNHINFDMYQHLGKVLSFKVPAELRL